MNDEQAARLGLVPCKRKPNTWHKAHYTSPACGCGACCRASAARSLFLRYPRRRQVNTSRTASAANGVNAAAT